MTTAAPTLTVGDANNYQFDGVISGLTALVKQGAGMQTLTNTNTYTGGTTVNAGTLRTTAGVAGALGSGSLAINAGAGVTTNVNLNRNEALNGFSANANATGTANLSVAGGSTLTVNAAGPTALTVRSM